MNNNTDDEKAARESKEIKLDRLKKGLFFTLTATFGLLSGFGLSLVRTKKKQTEDLYPKEGPETSTKKRAQERLALIEKQVVEAELQEAGLALARKALLRATIYSVGGFSLFCFFIWKLSGAKNFDEFRVKIGNTLPRIKRKEQQEQSRTEFDSLTDLFQYIIDVDKLEKAKKQQNNKTDGIK